MMKFFQYFLAPEFRRFLVVGGLGFFIDGGLLTVLVQNSWNIIPARAFSFFFAVSATWLLNRLWTFDSEKLMNIRREYAYYFSAQVLGAVINLSVFFALIDLHPVFRGIPLIPLAFGATISLAFNYLVSKKIIFKRR